MSEALVDLTADGFRLRRLRPDVDGPAVTDLMGRCAHYTGVLTGEPPAADSGAQFLAAAPDGRPLDDMLKLGILDNAGTLVGLIDIARGHPQPGTWYIGLLLLDPALRNRGLGAATVGILKRHAAHAGATRILLSVVQENRRALKFWQLQGFAITHELPRERFGVKEHVRLELAFDLRGVPRSA